MDKTLQYLENTLKNGDKIVIGVSSGPDSMCLLSLLENLQKKLDILIIVAHINHNIRKQSIEEEQYIRNYCKEKSLPCEVLKLENLKGNFEAEARKLRYDFFEKIIVKYKANYLMTAHHGDDLMETMLMRQIRGSSLKGYAGFTLETIYPTYKLVRPLLFYTKEEIENYIKIKNIKCYIDSTNFDDNHLRNRIRKYILPLLKKENPKVHEKYLQFSEEIKNADNILHNYTNEIIKQVYNNNRLKISAFKKQEKGMKKRIIQEILQKFYPNNLNKLTNFHTESILNLIKNESPNKKIVLPNNIIVKKQYDYIYFQTKLEKNTPIKVLLKEENNYNKQTIKKLSHSNDTSNNVIRLDSKELQLPLYIRTRKPGDKIEIKNLGGTKKVKDVFIDCKIPTDLRNTQLLVTDSTDTILWIPGVKKSKFDKEINEKYDIILWYAKEGEIYE